MHVCSNNQFYGKIVLKKNKTTNQQDELTLCKLYSSQKYFPSAYFEHRIEAFLFHKMRSVLQDHFS